MGTMLPQLKTSPIIKKIECNPILSKNDIPYEASLIFNAGVAKVDGRYLMVFRNDYGTDENNYSHTPFHGTSLGIAESDDGINWTVRSRPLIDSVDIADPEISRFYDPRLTVIDGKVYICFAIDTRHGVRGGIGVLDEALSRIEVLSLTAPDNRNLVLFPEKIGGRFVRLERPFPVYGRGGIDRFDIWASYSPDLKYWGETQLVLGVEDVPFANDKIGPAAPPVRTEKGWLTLFHAVDIDASRGKNGWEDTWRKRYCAGVMLLDLQDPGKVIGYSREPLIAPDQYYETDDGFRQHVIFPGGMILEPSGEVKIYYGAADTCECLAIADVRDLLALCTDKRNEH